MKFKIYLTSAFKKDAKTLSEEDKARTIKIINRLANGSHSKLFNK